MNDQHLQVARTATISPLLAPAGTTLSEPLLVVTSLLYSNVFFAHEVASAHVFASFLMLDTRLGDFNISPNFVLNLSSSLFLERNCVKVFPTQYSTYKDRSSLCYASSTRADSMQENMSGADELPEEERLQTSVRQRASGIEGYGVSITLSFDVDSIG